MPSSPSFRAPWGKYHRPIPRGNRRGTRARALAAEPRPQTREQAQAWLKSAGFRPITVEIDALTRLGARMFRANVAFDDHPFDRRMAGQIDTVTVEAVIRFVEGRDPQARKFLRSLPQDGALQPR